MGETLLIRNKRFEGRERSLEGKERQEIRSRRMKIRAELGQGTLVDLNNLHLGGEHEGRPAEWNQRQN